MPRVGADYAGYQIQGIVGRGGMSVVYQAEHPRLGRIVALKVLAADLAEDDRFRERFVRESKLAASLDHPNIIPIYDAGSADGLLFIAMRFVKGDLKSLLQREGRLRPGRTLRLIIQAAGALDSAHKLGLVHRDVKPANVLIAYGSGPEGGDHAYLADFGLTKHATSHSGITATGQFIGTVDYMAPEQIEGRPLDGRTDVYALGCILYECLTGKPPFNRDTDAALIWAHLKEEPPLVHESSRGLPMAVDDVVSRAMAKSVANRYPSCMALALAFRDALAEEFIEERFDEGSENRGEPLAHESPREVPVATVSDLSPLAGAASWNEREADSAESEGPPAKSQTPALNPSRGNVSRHAASAAYAFDPQQSSQGVGRLQAARQDESSSRPPLPSSPTPPVAKRSTAPGRLRWILTCVGAFLLGGLVVFGLLKLAGFQLVPSDEKLIPNTELTVLDLLKDHVPMASLSGCHQVPPPNARAFLDSWSCDYGNGVTVTYSYAHTGTEMKMFYAAEAHKAGIPKGAALSGGSRPTGDCKDPSSYPAESLWWRTTENRLQFHAPGTREGRVLCYSKNGGGRLFTISWEDFPLKIYSTASVPGGDVTTLLQAWEQALGPNNPEILGKTMHMP